MAEQNIPLGYKIWAVDNVVYGPVDLSLLTHWIKEERVMPDTWIFHQTNDIWQKASQIPELHQAFCEAQRAEGKTPPAEPQITHVNQLKPSALRRMKVLANMNDRQLERFREFLTLQSVPQFAVVVKQNDPGDAMFLVFEGELRVRLIIAGKESLITTLPAGEFFGEFCLFDHGPRSADVVANVDSLLLRLSASAYQQLLEDAPEVAAALLSAICKTLASRMRADNKRFRESIIFARIRD